MRCTASIVASVPELLKRHSGSPKRSASSSATTIASSVGWAKWVPCVTRRLHRLDDRRVGMARRPSRRSRRAGRRTRCRRRRTPCEPSPCSPTRRPAGRSSSSTSLRRPAPRMPPLRASDCGIRSRKRVSSASIRESMVTGLVSMRAISAASFQFLGQRLTDVSVWALTDESVILTGESTSLAGGSVNWTAPPAFASTGGNAAYCGR